MDEESSTIRGVITESKSGRRAILAQRVIDCTGRGLPPTPARFFGWMTKNTDFKKKLKLAQNISYSISKNMCLI